MYQLSVALLPAVALLVIIYRMDKIEKEPIALLLKLLGLGCLCALPSVPLEWLGAQLIAGIREPVPQRILEAVLVVALAEEGCKFAALCTTWRSRHFNYQYDAIVYAVCISLGFAALENLLYVMQYGLSTGLFRAFTTVPGHCFFGVYMGHYYGRAKRARYLHTGETPGNLVCALLLPLLLHGCYNFCCYMHDIPIFVVIFYVFLVIFFLSSIGCLRRAAREDRPVAWNRPHQTL